MTTESQKRKWLDLAKEEGFDDHDLRTAKSNNSNELSNKRQKVYEEILFSGVTEKKQRLKMGKLAIQFGGLLDRTSSKEQIFQGLVALAQNVGKKIWIRRTWHF